MRSKPPKPDQYPLMVSVWAGLQVSENKHKPAHPLNPLMFSRARAHLRAGDFLSSSNKIFLTYTCICRRVERVNGFVFQINSLRPRSCF